MLQIDIEQPGGTVRRLQAPDDCVIGKGAQNEVRLDSWRVGKEHARLFCTPSGVLLDDLGTFAGTSVNGERVQGQHGPLRADDVIGIGPFKLTVVEAVGDGPAIPSALHASRVGEGSALASPEKAAPEAIGEHVRQGERGTAAVTRRVPAPVAAIAGPKATASDAMRQRAEFEWRRRIHAKLLETMDLRRHDVHSMSDERLRRDTEALVRQIVGELEADIPAELDRALLRSRCSTRRSASGLWKNCSPTTASPKSWSTGTTKSTSNVPAGCSATRSPSPASAR